MAMRSQFCTLDGHVRDMGRLDGSINPTQPTLSLSLTWTTLIRHLIIPEPYSLIHKAEVVNVVDERLALHNTAWWSAGYMHTIV